MNLLRDVLDKDFAFRRQIAELQEAERQKVRSTTLREEVRAALERNNGFGALGDDYACDLTMDIIATALEATGAPAYIRVAKDLRGEWVEGGDEV